MRDDRTFKSTLAVVIPTWRRPKRLIQLLQSLQQQLRIPDEILIVCRDTDRDSLEAVAAWGRDPKNPLSFTVLTVDHGGHLPPLIAALQRCKSDIFCLIDDDAIPREDWLLRFERGFSDPAVGGIGGTIVNHFDPKGGSPGRPAVEHPAKLSWFGRSGNYRTGGANSRLFEADCPVGCNMAFRRVAMEGCFDMVLNNGSAISFETDVALNVKKKGFGVYYDPDSVVDHFLTARQIESQRGWNSKECYVYAHNLTYICLKHLPWYGKIGFLVYFFIGGSWGCPGPGTYLLGVLRGRPASWKEQLLPSLRGRLSGVMSFIRNRSRLQAESERLSKSEVSTTQAITR